MIQRFEKNGWRIITFCTFIFSVYMAYLVKNYSTKKENVSNSDNLYLPRVVPLSLYEERGEIITSNHEDVNIDFQRQGNRLFIEIGENPYSDLLLELPLYYYKGYTGKDIGNNQLFNNSLSDNGLVLFDMGNCSNQTIVVEYTGTILQKICDWITVVTIVIVILVIMRNRKIKK